MIPALLILGVIATLIFVSAFALAASAEDALEECADEITDADEPYLVEMTRRALNSRERHPSEPVNQGRK